MIDPFDHALSDFIDNLPEEAEAARRLLEEAAPFSGHGDLPELAELATMLRAVPSPEPRPEWMAAAKARLMAAPVVPPEKRGLTWLGTMFLPLTQLTFPSLPKLSMPTPVLARAAVAAALVVTLGSMATSGSIARNPLLQVTGQQGPVAEAQQAIAALEQQLGGSNSSPRDIVLLSKQLQLADDAIDQAPPADQPRLRAQLQGAVTAVRFDGTLETILNPTTVQVDGVAIQADAAVVQQLRTGQHISLQVTVTSNGKLQAVDVTPEAPAATSISAVVVQTNSTSSSGPGSGGRGPGHDGTAPPINEQPVSADETDGAQTPANSEAQDGDSGDKKVKTSDASPTAGNAASAGATQGNDSSANGKGKSFGALTSVVISGNAGPDPSSTPAKHGAGDSPSNTPSKGASASAQASGAGSPGSSASGSQSSGSDKKGSDKAQPSAPAATLQTPAATTTGPAASSSSNSGNPGKPAANSQSDSGKGDKGQGNSGKVSAPKADAPQAPAPKAASGNSSSKGDNSGKKK